MAARAGLSWTKPLVLAALLAAAAMAAVAQSARSGSLAGRLTDLHSAPQEGATVILRNRATGAETHAITARNGSYRFTGLEAGEYTLEAESPQLGRGRLVGILVIAGHEAHLQTAMQFEQLSPESILAAGRNMVRPDFVPVALPALDIAFTVEPLRALAQRGQRLVDIYGGVPAAESSVMTATLAAEPLSTMPVSGRQVPALPRETPPTKPLDLIATKPREELHTLPLTAVHEVPIIAAATGLLQASARIAEQPRKPVRVMLQGVDPVTPAVTSTIAAAELQSLPVSGRRWQEFVLDTSTASAQEGGEGSVSPRRAQQPTETTLDGASKRLAFGGAGSPSQGAAEPVGMSQPWAGRRGLAISEAAIRQVETVAGNVESTGTRSAGGRVNVETQRGANGLHGQGFFFDRLNTWGAQNPYTQWVKETSPATQLTFPVFTAEAYTPPDHEATWGIGVGSHIRRDKLFWFAALDGYHRNDPGVATVRHPEVFFAQPGTCTTACPSDSDLEMLSSRLGPSNNPLVAGVAAFSGVLEKLGGLLGPAPRSASQWTGFGRIDWEAAERHRFTFEGTSARWNSPGGGLTRVSETYGSNSFGSSEASEVWLLGRWDAFLTPNLLAVTQASAGRTILSARPETPSAFEQAFLSQSVWGQLPQIIVDNRYGFTIGNPSRFGQGSYPDERLYQEQESMDWVRRGLLAKAGLSLSHNADATSLLRNQTGTYSYANLVNFASDALVFLDPTLRSDPLDPRHQHNCDQTGNNLGPLPCYSYYSQTIGPTGWHLSTNDWAGYVTAQWQADKWLTLSAGLRWEREQMPPPIASLTNPELPLTATLPSLGNNWGPRLSLAMGSTESHWPVLRLGYGTYFGRTQNATLLTALTQTGSAKGDMNFFLRPTDDLPNYGGGAPPFPYVMSGAPGTMVKPGTIEFAPNFRNAEIHQGIVALEERLPSHVQLTASALVSLGRRLPISIDTNFDPTTTPQTITYAVKPGAGTATGPITASQITVPFYSARLNPNYQQITQIMSRANSTYEAAMLRVDRYGRRGLTLHAHYTYSHAMDWNPNESTQVAGSDVLDPADFSQEYGTSNLDVRHAAFADLIWVAPWKLHNLAGRVGNNWMLSGIGQFRTGRPYTMRTSGSLANKVQRTINGSALIEALGPGMNGSGGDNRVYGVGRNTFRYPFTWKADLRLGKRFDLGQMRQLELLAESFNLFNHQNVTELETIGYSIAPGSVNGGLPALSFLTGLKANTTAFGQPLNINATNFYRERQIQFGLRLRF